MVDNKPDEQKVEVPLSTLTKLQEQMAQLEKQRADDQARIAGLEQMAQDVAPGSSDQKLREKKNFEPAFRTVRLRKYAVAGNHEDQDYVVGWTNRGAYQEVDRTGVSPQVVDYIEVIFLRYRDEKPIKAEKIRLHDLLNKGTPVDFRIIERKGQSIKIPTGEEIDVSIYDPAHGMVATGEKIDGFVVQTDEQLKLQLPDGKDLWIDAVYAN